MEQRVADVLRAHAERTARFPYIDWERFAGSSIIVTGATGLIGSAVVRTLAAADSIHGLGLEVVAAVRDPERASGLLDGNPQVRALRWSAGEPIKPDRRADFLVHAASPTASRVFVETPVETIETIVGGGKAALDLAQRDGCRTVMLSSMEVYGRSSGRFDESYGGDLDTMKPRSSYPEAKRLAECLCASYVSEYGAAACIVRLAQTFGQGVSSADGRAFAEFARCALAGESIVLATDGTKENPYLSVDDAVGAVLCTLLEGDPGSAYNAANEATYCSVRDMAGAALRWLGNSKIKVIVAAGKSDINLYPDASRLDMDCSRLRALGWEAHDGFAEMFSAMGEVWSEEMTRRKAK